MKSKLIEVRNKVADELKDVNGRHDKLSDYLDTEPFYKLSVKHQRLLRAQFGAMGAYMWILFERIDDLDKQIDKLK